MAIIINPDASLTLDESSGAQSSGADSENNEIDLFGSGTSLPVSFGDALSAVTSGQSVPTVAGLSGYSTTQTSGIDLFSFGPDVTDLSFTDASGDPLAGADSNLVTSDGTKIFLYTYPGDDNVLLAVKGNDNGTPGDPSDDFAIAPGSPLFPTVVFAAYLEPTVSGVGTLADTDATGAKVWVAQYEAMFHPDATDPDDAVSPADIIYVTVDQNSSFSLEGAPSGQNLFLMYGDPDLAIVVTAKNAASGGTVNTGQGGGGTTIGSNNQMIDPGEGMVFTFVTGAVPGVTVPLLDQNEADLESNIQFGGVHGSGSASFTVVQTQPASKSSTLTIRAFATDVESGSGFLAGYADDTDVAITSVTVTSANGQPASATISIVGGVATITGAKAGDRIEYHTSGDHNRVQIDNTGAPHAKTGADFDIGDFSIPRPVTESVLFNALAFEDDGPTLANAVVSSEVDEDGLAGGNPGGPDDLDADDGSNDDNDGDETTASGNIAGLFVGGADGLASFGLSDDPLDLAGLPQSLSSKGDAVTYSVVGNKLTASAGGREVFTLEITNAATGAYLFTLKDQLDHGTVDTEDEINLQLGAILMATDGDGDTATAQADDLVITVDDDTPDPLQPGDITADNEAGATASAALGYYGRVGADEDGTVSFVGGTDGDVLQGIVQDGTPALENLLFDGSNIYLWGFGTDELIGTTQNENPFDDANTSDWVFKMSLNPDGAVQASDTYDITMYKTVANVQDVDFGAFVSKVASGNPLYKLVEDIGGSTYDALFSGWIGAVQQTVNIATVGVGVGTGQDFNAGDRMMIQFLEDDGAGDAVVSNAEERVVNRFTFVMNQNNPPHDDGDLTIRVYDAAGNEIQITGILINGETLVGAGGGPVDSNDDNGSVTADANGLGFDLHGLGGGTGGSLSDNDTVTVIAAGGYVRIDVIGTGADTNKDTFDILVKSVAIPVVYDIDFSVQAALVDEDLDTTLPADLDVTLVGVVGV